jgi:hypothetical protein
MLELMDLSGAERWIHSYVSRGIRHGWDYKDDTFFVVLQVKLDLGSAEDFRPMSVGLDVVAFPNGSGSPLTVRSTLQELSKQKFFEAGIEVAQALVKAIPAD